MSPEKPLSRGIAFAALVGLGMGWGMTQSLGKIAVSTGHGPFGVIFWQLVVCTAVLGAISLARGRGIMWNAPALRFALIVAVLGTLVPNATFYTSVTYLPAGIMSILISAVPLMSLPIALALGAERFSAKGFMGLMLGLGGVAMIAAASDSFAPVGMGGWAMIGAMAIAMVGPLFYALEANYVAHRGTAGMDAVQAMFMASLAGVILCLPVTLATGQWFSPWQGFGRAETALAISSTVHALCYAGYVWLASRAGAVFASQCSYLVTGAGVVWAVLLLGEHLPAIVWVALAVMLSGVALVQPRGEKPQGEATGKGAI